MKLTTTAVDSLIQAVECDPVELYELYLDATNPDQVTHRFTSHIHDLTFGEDVYTAIGVTRSTVELSSDLAVDYVSLSFDDTDRTFSQSIRNIDFNGKRIVVKKVFLSLLSSSADHVIVFDGKLGDPTFSENIFSVTAYGYLNILMKKVPRRSFSPSCQYRYGDEWCTVNKSSVTSPLNCRVSTAQGGDYLTLVSSAIGSSVDSVANYWRLGELIMVSGSAAGQIRYVKSSGVGFVTVTVSFSSPISSSDQFMLFRGCDKTNTDCACRFNNFLNFGGFHTIPLHPKL